MSQYGHLLHRTVLRRIVTSLLIAAMAAAGGCKPGGESATWLLNGLLDPTQQGQFLKPRRNEIRASLSILEEPIGIQDADEPRPEDLLVEYHEHRIIPGDILSITIFELLIPGQASTQQVLVSTSGIESLPVIGRVRLSGLTVSELEMDLKQRLREADILPDPEIQVSLLSTRGTRFSVIGSVPRAGSFEVPQPDFRLLQALADAGGLSPVIQKVYVFRKGAAVSSPNTISNLLNSSSRRSDRTWNSRPMLTDVSGGASSAPSTFPATGPDDAWLMEDELPANGQVEREPNGFRNGTSPVERPPPIGIDELEILETGPTAPEQAIIWDPEKGWVITPVDSAAETPDTETARALDTGEPWPQTDELSPQVRIIEIPTKELLSGDPRYNIVIRPFDLINIPPGVVGEYYMMGNIARPGAYDITGRRMTVKEAIASAGGFGPLAWPSRADLIRRISQDEEQIIQLDLDAIFAGNAPDFYLRPNDIVNVGTNPAAVFLAVLRNAFRFSYGFGFVYDRNYADVDTFQARMQMRQFRNTVRQQQGLPIR